MCRVPREKTNVIFGVLKFEEDIYRLRSRVNCTHIFLKHCTVPIVDM